MKINIIEMLQRARGACCVSAAGLFLLGSAHSVQAGWTASDTSHAWSGYNNNYLFQDNGYEDHFSSAVGTRSVNANTFWEQAEEIEVAEDAYYWAQIYDSANIANYKNEVEDLCDGFVEYNKDDWSWDNYNDDMAWMCVAFIRAYDITGTTRWLNDAENNYNTIWSRGEDANDYGIWWTSPPNYNSSHQFYQNSAANWTFVIAGNLIYRHTGDQNELNRANTVYGFCKQHLYNSSNGQVYDGYYPIPTPPETIEVNITYNYGVAIGAATYEEDSSTVVNTAIYLVYGMNGGGTMPDYGRNNNNSGFNGIALRWLGLAIDSGYGSDGFGSGVVTWAQDNVSTAWSIRDGQELMWNDWFTNTPPTSSGQVYSWDCSSAMAGMFDIPMP